MAGGTVAWHFHTLLFLSGLREFNLIALNSVIVGLAMGAGMPLMGAIVGSRFGPTSTGRAMGLLYTFVAFCSIGPVLTGWIRDVTGRYSGAFIAYLSALPPAIILIGFSPEQEGMPAEDRLSRPATSANWARPKALPCSTRRTGNSGNGSSV
jgi:MFS family permease